MRLPQVLATTVLAWLVTGCATHVPDYCCHRTYSACRDLDDLYRMAPEVDHPLSLEEVLSIALEHNLDVRLQEIEEAAHCNAVVEQKLKGLGRLTAFGELEHRDRNTGSSSESLSARAPAPPSFSSEKDTRRADLTYVWSTLDFGMSRILARQESEKHLILQQRHLRARQNLVLDVFKAYYKAVVAQSAMQKADALIERQKDRLESLEAQIADRTVSEMRGLLQKDRILDVEVRLHAFTNEYRSAMAELQALMGMPPGCLIELAPIDLELRELAQLDLCDLEYQALTHRPELLTQDMQMTVDALEVRRAFLEMYPNVSLFGGYNHDANKFLVFSNWLSVGAKLSYDLLSLPSKRKAVCKNQFLHRLNQETRLSMSVGVMTQVHLAYINVDETLTQYRLAKQLNDVKGRMWELAVQFEDAGQFDADEVIDHEIEALFAELNAYKSYANVQVALEQLGNSIGRPLAYSEEDIGCEMWNVRQLCDAELYEWNQEGNIDCDGENVDMGTYADSSDDAHLLLVYPETRPVPAKAAISSYNSDDAVIDADTVLVIPPHEAAHRHHRVEHSSEPSGGK